MQASPGQLLGYHCQRLRLRVRASGRGADGLSPGCYGGGLLMLADPHQRLGHRCQRLRLPVRVGDGAGHVGGVLILARLG